MRRLATLLLNQPSLIVARTLPAMGARWASAFWALAILGGALPMLVAGAMGWLIAEVPGAIAQRDPAQLAPPLIAVGALFLVSQAHTVWLAAITRILGGRLADALRGRVMDAAMRPAGIAHLEDPSVADQVDRSRELGYGWSAVDALPSLGVVLTARIKAAIAAVVLTKYAWWATPLAMLGYLGPTLYRLEMQRLFLRRAQAQTQGLRRAKYLRRVVVGGTAAKETRVFGIGGFLAERHRESWFGGMDDIWLDRKRLTRFAVPALAGYVAGLGALFWFMAGDAATGAIGLAALIVYVQAVFALQGFGTQGDESWQLQASSRVISNANKMDELTEHPHARLSGAQTTRFERAIRFDTVGFAYPGTTARVLDAIDLDIPAGTSLAIVGENGAGKTTMMKLLCRLYDPTSGAITVDGVPLADMDPRAWRRNVGVIFQDFVRYDLSARDNIALGAPHLQDDRDAIERCARRAGAFDALDRVGWDATLSRGYEDGAELSGGEWQRVALARALFAVEGGARLLILDEPTANLDVRAEADLYERFLELTQGVTTILISHRFSTVRLAERICVIEHGRVVELGSHADLLQQKGRYAEMFTKQASAYHDDHVTQETV